MTREEAIQRLKEYSQYAHGIYHNEQKDEEAFDMATEALSGRPQGEWIEVEDYIGDVHYKCTQCGEEWTFPDGTPEENNANFCPKCGADLRGKDNENNSK